jgi:membrane-bound serine protease (ClpP class)
MLLVTAILLLIFVVPPAIGIPLVILAAIAEVLELVFWRRYLARYRVTTGSEALVGEEATVVEPCAPEGTVRLRGEIWKARSSFPCAAGERVRVTGVDGLTLEVEPPA